MQVSLLLLFNAKGKHGDASFSLLFFNAKENIQQNIYTSKICNQFNLGIEPRCLLWN